MRDAVQPPIGSDSEQQHEDMDPMPCPEDEEFFVSPDAASMEEAIGKFMEGLERQERGTLGGKGPFYPSFSGW